MPSGEHFLISGRVQGVGFRAAAQARARELGLTGWVKNLADGRVELRAWGPENALGQFISWLHQGPTMARVESVQRSPVTETEQPEQFRIL